jgi:hypothetical protein
MIHVYVNYPIPKFSVHENSSCATIGKHRKEKQLLVRLDVDTLSDELRRFAEKEYVFTANPAGNDMWLDIDFRDREFEYAVLRYVQKLIGRHYTPLARCEIQTHC